MSLAVTDVWADAEQLWTQAARKLRGRGQAAAATLLGFVHYAHGNGAMGLRSPSTLALEASPGYSMATLYNDALIRGIPPEVINRCAETGFAVARSVGVELPPPVPAAYVAAGASDQRCPSPAECARSPRVLVYAHASATITDRSVCSGYQPNSAMALSLDAINTADHPRVSEHRQPGCPVR